MSDTPAPDNPEKAGCPKCPFCGSTRIHVHDNFARNGVCYACLKWWTADSMKIRELTQSLAAAQERERRLTYCLRHMQWCASCSEGSWEDCETGKMALAALSAEETKP